MITEEFDKYLETETDRFRVQAFVDNLDSPMDDPPAGVIPGRIDKAAIEEVLVQRGILLQPESSSWSEMLKGRPRSAEKVLNPDKKVMILVCGPEG